MGVELDIDSELDTQLKADSTLTSFLANGTASIIQGWQREQITVDQTPKVYYQLIRIDLEDEEYLGVPKKKAIIMEYEIHGIAKSQTNAIDLDEKIKNALETDLTLGGKASHIEVGTSDFQRLDEDFNKTILEIKIHSNRFTAGSR